MPKAEANVKYLSEIEWAILKRYNLDKMLNNEKFITYVSMMIGALGYLFEHGVSLSPAVELTSCALKYDPQVFNALLEVESTEERERIIRIFSLAIIEQLTNQGYLERSSSTSKTKTAKINKKVIVVGGRDYSTVAELKLLLHGSGLETIVLSEQPSSSRTILEKLADYSDVGYAIVVLDSEVNRDRQISEPSPNVMLEIGYLIGLLGRDRVLCLARMDVSLPIDINELNFTRFKYSVREVEQTVISELKTAHVLV